MLLKSIISLAIATTTVISVVAETPSVLQLSENMTDSTIVYPESFVTDVEKMMGNWYLRNYAVLDSLADYRQTISATDKEITDRLAKIPAEIELPFNSLVRSYIDMYTLKKRSLVENMLGMSHFYMPIFEQALEKENMPLELKYLPVIESALNPDAVSKAGATGLWQFMTPTAKGLGLEVNTLVDERRDPVRSSEMAAKYLKQLHDIYGDWSLAIAAYNCGPGNVNKALQRAGGGRKDFWEIYPFLPAETRGYVPCFIAACYVMTYHNQHNIAPALIRRPVVTDSVHVTHRVHLQQIADVLQIPIDEIKALNPQYRKDIIPGDIKTYSLVLPSRQIYSYILSEDSIVARNPELSARRLTVEPSDGTSTTISDDGNYVITQKVQLHKVKRGETLSSIAKKYGVTVSSLRTANGVKSVRANQTIKVVTTSRTLRSKEEIEADKESLALEETEAKSDSAALAQAKEIINSKPAQESKPKAETTPKKNTVQNSAAKPKQNEPVYVTIRNGDSLSKIAQRNNTTVAKLKQLNNLKNDRISAGKKLRVK